MSRWKGETWDCRTPSTYTDVLGMWPAIYKHCLGNQQPSGGTVRKNKERVKWGDKGRTPDPCIRGSGGKAGVGGDTNICLSENKNSLIWLYKVSEKKSLKGIYHQNSHFFKNCIFCPSWCGTVDWAPASELKGHRFHPPSGHMPGLWARAPVGGVWGATNQLSCFSRTWMFLSLSSSFPSPISKNK